MTRVAYCCPFVPSELIAACGLQPCRVPLAACPPVLSASKSGTDVRAARRTHQTLQAALAVLPSAWHHAACPGMCPYTRAVLAEVTREPRPAAVILTTRCDQMRRAADLLADEADTKTFLLNVPKTWQTVAARDLYRQELDRLGRFLTQIGGRWPCDDALIAVMRSRSHRPEPEPARSDISASARTNTPVRLALVGGPLLKTDLGLFDPIEQAGGQVVLDGTESGERTQPAHFDEHRLTMHPLDELARAYFGIPEIFHRPNTRLYDWLTRRLHELGVQGIIVHRYLWCDLWHAEVDRFRRTFGLPVLDLDFGDGDGLQQARTATRIQAFLEAMQ